MIANSQIEGVKIKLLNILNDDPDLDQEVQAGNFAEILRASDNLLLKFAQCNVSLAHYGTIKAFHWHQQQDDLWFMASGRAGVVLFDQRDNSTTKGQLEVIYCGQENYKLILIPKGVVHGYKVLSKEPCILFYLVTEEYNHHNPDELRINPFDPTINFNWHSLK